MGLFDNVGNLLDLFVGDDKAPEKQTLANRADVSTGDFGKIAAIGLPAIMQAIQRNTKNEQGLDSFNNALKKHQDVDSYQSVDQMSQNVDPQDGDKILGHVFNDKQSIFDRIAGSVGMSPAAVKRVLVLLAPLALKYFADRKNSKNLDKQGLQKETNDVTQNLTQALGHKGGLLGSVLGGLTSGNKDMPDKDDGILDDIFKMFR